MRSSDILESAPMNLAAVRGSVCQLLDNFAADAVWWLVGTTNGAPCAICGSLGGPPRSRCKRARQRILSNASTGRTSHGCVECGGAHSDAAARNVDSPAPRLALRTMDLGSLAAI